MIWKIIQDENTGSHIFAAGGVFFQGNSHSTQTEGKKNVKRTGRVFAFYI